MIKDWSLSAKYEIKNEIVTLENNIVVLENSRSFSNENKTRLENDIKELEEQNNEAEKQKEVKISELNAVKLKSEALTLEKNALDEEIIEQVYVQLKYSGYIEKEINNAEKLTRLEDIKIPTNFDYDKVKSLSFESKEKFKNIRPATISQASRISGVSPTDISILLVHMGRWFLV